VEVRAIIPYHFIDSLLSIAHKGNQASLRGAKPLFLFNSPFPSQGKGDKGGWGRQKPKGGRGRGRPNGCPQSKPFPLLRLLFIPLSVYVSPIYAVFLEKVGHRLHVLGIFIDQWNFGVQNVASSFAHDIDEFLTIIFNFLNSACA